MPRTMEQRSAQSYGTGIKGFITGAVIGGLVGVMFSMIRGRA